MTLAAVLLAWLAFMPAPQAEPVTMIRNNGSSANRVDLVILGDGYTQAEIDSGKYANDVEAFVQGMFAEEPYREYQNYFNVSRVDVVSNESGADHPDAVRRSSGTRRSTATYNCSRHPAIDLRRAPPRSTPSSPTAASRATCAIRCS